MRAELGPGRVRDQGGMDAWYPQFALTIPLHHPPRWTGSLHPFRTRHRVFRVVLEYGEHDTSIAKVWIVRPEVSRRTHLFHPHLNGDGSVCSFFVPDRTYDPAVHDISALVDLVGDWLRKHMFFEELGWWPGPEAPHDPRQVLTALRAVSSALCVCGGGLTFRQCCEDRYRQVATLVEAGRIDPQGLPRGGVKKSIEDALKSLRLHRGPLGSAALLPHLGPPSYLLDDGQPHGGSCISPF